ncbi:kinase-like domain-containing protein [Russula emetica]|nr:kinase-like domain-containing protein [Russula emetica]
MLNAKPFSVKGHSATFIKGKWEGEQVAVKMFRPVSPPDHIKGSFKEKFMDQVKPVVSFYRELVNWKVVSGSNSVWPLLGFTMWLDRDEMTIIFALVSPLAEGHLKLSYMNWQSLKPKKFANYFHDAATGLQSLHDHNVIHGDIRPVRQQSSIAQRIPKGLDSSVTGRNEYSDIYSFGSTMYQVLTREPLNIATGQPNRPRSCLGQEWEAIWDLILRCVSEEQDVRPSAVELVESLTAILNAFPDVVL